MSSDGPRIVMLGLRGFPDVQGGIEKHVEALAPLLVARGWDVSVIGRRPYLPSSDTIEYQGVKILPIWAPRRKSLETILHTALGVLVAARHRPDVLHIHAVGPSLMVPFARLLGMRVMVTHHGYDYDRGKWSPFAKSMLRLGENFGMRFANGRIAISGDVSRTMERRYDVPVSFVPNGVIVPPVPATHEILDKFGLLPRRYLTTVGRLVPEKRHLDLIAAFSRLDDRELKLVIIGASDHPDAYTRSLHEAALATPNVVMTGFQTGAALAELFSNAALFVLPSSHEGMPIALLEALGHGLRVVASDIVANKELLLHPDDYFPLGDIDALVEAIERGLANPLTLAEATAQMARTREAYAWSRVADRTAEIYRDLLWDVPRRVPVIVRSENMS